MLTTTVNRFHVLWLVPHFDLSYIEDLIRSELNIPLKYIIVLVLCLMSQENNLCIQKSHKM